jgi:hypothetical protein
MSSSNTNTNSNNNKKVLYQLWTDGRGSFAVRKEEDIQLFEYSRSQQSYSKVIDSKMLYDGSITEDLVQDWIEELKEANILDEDGNLIYVEF